MAKILTDNELGEIIHKATHDPGLIDDGDSYVHFLEDLGNLVANHFGGNRGTVLSLSLEEGEGLGYTVSFHVNECVPGDGGVFKDYDTDVTWKDGKETQG